MPKVPEYGDPQVATRPLPGARLTYDPGNPGAAIGAGLQRLGAGVQDLYLAEQKKQSEVAVLDADGQLSKQINAQLYDPETGALNRRGKDSFGLPDEVLPAFDKTTREIEKGLTNNDQRQAFRRLAAGRRKEIDQTVLRHVSGEMRKFEDETTDSYIKNEQNLAIADPAVVDASLARQHFALTRHAASNGLPPEWLKQQVEAHTSKTHLGVVTAMLARGDVNQGAAYIEARRGEFAGIDAAKSEDLLVRAQKQQRENVFLRAASAIEQNGGFVDPVRKSAAWLAMSPEQRHALEVRSRQVRKGDEPVQEDKRWLEFLDLGPSRLASMSEAELQTHFRPYLDDHHFDRAAALWHDARSGRGAGAEHVSNVLTFKDRIGNTLRGGGFIDPNKKPSSYSDAEVQTFARFETEAAAQLEHFERTALQGKRKATGEEMQKVIDGLLVRKVFVEGRLWGGEEKPSALLTDSERKRATWPDAPRDPSKRTAGQIYNTPKGELTWTGTAWRKN